MSDFGDKYPSLLLQDAVESIRMLPGVGKWSALRLALYLLRQDAVKVHHFTESIARLRDEARYCRECMMLSDGEVCSICADHSRDHNLICVVESIRDVMSIEATGQYHGVYHVLGGIISPIAGIGPSDVTVKELVSRIASSPDPSALEVVLALSGDVDGDTTSFYIYRQISPFGVKVSTLARGLSFGDGIEYADPITLGRSIAARQPFKPA